MACSPRNVFPLPVGSTTLLADRGRSRRRAPLAGVARFDVERWREIDIGVARRLRECERSPLATLPARFRPSTRRPTRAGLDIDMLGFGTRRRGRPTPHREHCREHYGAGAFRRRIRLVFSITSDVPDRIQYVGCPGSGEGRLCPSVVGDVLSRGLVVNDRASTASPRSLGPCYYWLRSAPVAPVARQVLCPSIRLSRTSG